MSGQITWGPPTASHISFVGERVPVSSYEQGLVRIGSGAEIERSARNGITVIKFSDFSGGLVSVAGIQPWASMLNTFTKNEGIQTRLPRLAVLPYALTAQATLDAVNHSGTVAANIRGHSGNTSLGTTGLRHIYFLKNYIFTDTSLTDPVMVELTDTVLTDTVTAIEPNAIFNNVAYFAAAYNGVAEDVQGFSTTVALTYNPSQWTKLVTLDANDYINAMRTMQTLGPGVNVFVGMIGGTNQVWYCKTTSSTLPQTSATLGVSVIEATKNVPGSIANVTGTSIDLTLQGTDNSTASPISEGAMTTSSNAFAFASASVYTGRVIFGNGAFSASYPKGRRVIGIAITVAHTEQNALDNIFVYEVKVNAGGATSQNLSDGYELSTSGTDAYGGSSSTGGMNILTDDLDELTVILSYWSNGAANVAAGDLTVTDVDIVITYASDGTSLAFPLGGWQTAPNPAFPNRIAMVAPERTDKTTILVPRKLWFLDFDWDSSGDRPVFTPSNPQTNMAYLHHATPWQGGYAITGGDVAGPGKFIRHIDGNGVLRNLSMPQTNGAVEFRCNELKARGSYLVATMVASDYTDAQDWLYSNGKWFPDTLMQSLGPAAIAAQAIPAAESALGLQQQQIYRFYPVSTTHLAVIRQFLPDDLDADPRLVNTAKVKSMAFTSNTTENLSLKLRSPELDFGPEEANKTLITTDFQGRSISATSTVTSRIDTGGDTAFTAAEVTKEFVSAFEHYDIPSAGVAYDTLIHEVGLKHTAASADTPNGTGLLYGSVQQWEELQTVWIEIDMNSIKPDVFALHLEHVALAATKNVQPLKVGSKTFDSVFEGLFYTANVPARGQVISAEHLRPFDPRTSQPVNTRILAKYRQVRKTAA